MNEMGKDFWRESAEHMTRHWIARASEASLRAFGVDVPMPVVEINVRGTSAGKFHYPRKTTTWGHDGGRIRYNDTLLFEHKNEFVRTVVPHEVAHAVVCAVHEREGLKRVAPHGVEWQRVMHFFGLPADVTHPWKVRAVGADYRYLCACPGEDSEHWFTRRKHSNAQAGTGYRCRRCRTTLVFEPEGMEIARAA